MCYCGFCNCKPCLERWIVSDNRDPSCPNCKRILSQDYIYSNCSSSFLKNEYMNWRQTYLAVQEKIYLADDFETVRLEQKRRTLRNQLLSLYRKKKMHLRKKMDVREIIDSIAKIKADMPSPIRRAIVKKDDTIRQEFVLPCPKCRGYIRRQDYKCTLCETGVCHDCLNIWQTDHECDKEDVINARNIMNNTKACPQCAVRIYKISGCDQMWCVQCHCSFSWETGHPLAKNAVIHNPHYFDWFFSRTPETNNDECINFVGYVRSRLHTDAFKQRREYYQMLDIFRMILHIDNVILEDMTATHLTNQDLRYKYLLHDIDDEDLERLLYKREIKHLKRNAVHDLYNSFNIILKDAMIKYVDNEMDLNIFHNTFNTLYDETSECAENIVARYGGVVKHFTEIERLHYWFNIFVKRITDQDRKSELLRMNRIQDT